MMALGTAPPMPDQELDGRNIAVEGINAMLYGKLVFNFVREIAPVAGIRLSTIRLCLI
jgi:hypothetical protein